MIVDLRDYTLVPSSRDALIERCEQLFYPEQERLGAIILGSFRDADDPGRLVWLRGMPDMATRQRVLTAFYADGAMWRAHRDEVNSWIVDSDNVLLLRPISELAAPARGASTVGMYTHVGPRPLPADEAAALDRRVSAAIAAAGGRQLVTLVTDPSPNNYPRHPIRTGEHGLVWFATFAEWRPLAAEVPVERRRLLPNGSSRMR